MSKVDFSAKNEFIESHKLETKSSKILNKYLTQNELLNNGKLSLA